MARGNAPAHPVLRLVNRPGEAGRRVSFPGNTGWSGNSDRAGGIAGGAVDPLGPSDARWVFAARVASQIEGGRAAVLRPERRERLMQTARALGIRAFDASLVIAMVQDVARRGEVPEGHPPLTPGLAERLTVVPEPRRRVEKVGLVQRAAAACLIATGLVALAMMWVQGG